MFRIYTRRVNLPKKASSSQFLASGDGSLIESFLSSGVGINCTTKRDDIFCQSFTDHIFDKIVVSEALPWVSRTSHPDYQVYLIVQFVLNVC